MPWRGFSASSRIRRSSLPTPTTPRRSSSTSRGEAGLSVINVESLGEELDDTFWKEVALSSDVEVMDDAFWASVSDEE
jgi:hypothetical protein